MIGRSDMLKPTRRPKAAARRRKSCDPLPRLGERLAEDREHVAMFGAHLQRAFR